MSYLFFIAKRYFKTNNSKNYVHIISWVSSFGIVVGTAALILLLSVFSGFESLVLGMYNSFDPDLKISSKNGDVFYIDELDSILINSPNLKNTVYVLEEKVLLRNGKKDFIATAKGVSKEYLDMTSFDSLLVSGQYLDKFESNRVAILGRGVAYHLSIGSISFLDHLQVIIPNRNVRNLLNTSNAFNQSPVMPVGLFGIQSEIDEKYIITPLSFLQDLSEREYQASYVEVKLNDGENIFETQILLTEELGSKFKVENRYEQQAFLYKILKTEKLAVFIILLFIMIIAAFNIVGSLTMLMLDKANDINILRTLGCTIKDIKNIFIYRSVLSISIGTLVGLIIGLFIAVLQKKFGLIRLGQDSFVVDFYPIKFVFEDIVLATISVFIIGILASLFSIKVLTNKLFKNKI